MVFLFRRSCVLLLSFALISSASAQTKSPADNQLSSTDLGYTLAVQAAIYGLAPVGMLERLSREVIDPATRVAPFDAYNHRSTLASPTEALFASPNNDTLYSIAWLDLRTEPVLLQMPETHGRFYVAQILDMYSDTIANYGSLNFGTSPGVFAIVGPNWKGSLPPEVKASTKCDSSFALVLLRVIVDGPADLAAASSLQKEFQLAALSRYLQKQTGAPPDSLAGLHTYKSNNASEWFHLLDEFLRVNPTRSGEDALITQFATIGIGPKHVVLQVPTDAALLSRAQSDANHIIAEAGLQSGTLVNGWRLFTKSIGTYGFDYLQRSSVWAGGPLANLPTVSFYPTAVTDASGQPLDGAAHDYVIRFAKDQIPPVDGFWSVTMYKRSDGMLVSNPIDRYSIGNRTKGLEFGPDGSLTLYVQRKPPAGSKAANWLPAPDGPFYITLRLYGPKPAVWDGNWTPPPVEAQH